MGDALKSCPFCGEHGRPALKGNRGVRCVRCKAWGPDPLLPQAMVNWNMRPDIETLEARIRELERCLRSIACLTQVDLGAGRYSVRALDLFSEAQRAARAALEESE